MPSRSQSDRSLAALGHAARSLAWGLAVAFACAACDRCGAKHEETSAPAIAAPLPPVPAPEGLLAEATIATPDATWGRVQRGVGGIAGILPSTLGGLVCALSGIDPSIAPLVDGASPAYAVLAGDPASPAWVVAVRLVDARRARASFVGGDAGGSGGGGTARVHLRPLGDFEVLDGDRPRSPSTPVAALAPTGHLVVARAEADLTSLAPYATRTLPTRPASTSAVTADVPGAALAGGVASAIERRWGAIEEQMLAQDKDLRAQHGGRAPDFGDPRAIVGTLDGWVQKRLAALRDLKGLHATLDADDATVRARVEATPATPSGPASAMAASLAARDLAPLFALPGDTAAALLGGDDAAARAAGAQDAEAAIAGALGARLTPADAKRLHAALGDWAASRGDVWTLAFEQSDDARGFVLRAHPDDAKRAARAVGEGLDLVAHAKAIREPLASLGVTDVKLATRPAAGGGTAQTATLVTGRPPGLAIASAPAAGGWLGVAASVGAVDGAIALVDRGTAPSAGTLGDRAWLHPAAPLPASAAGAFAADVTRAPSCAGQPGGALVEWGATGGTAWIEGVITDTAIRCATRF